MCVFALSLLNLHSAVEMKNSDSEVEMEDDSEVEMEEEFDVRTKENQVRYDCFRSVHLYLLRFLVCFCLSCK